MFFKKRCNHQRSYKVEADFADPIWCAECNWNIDIDDLPISEELKKDFVKWEVEYQKEMSLLKEQESEHFQEFVSKHNDEGRRLAERLIRELGENISITFVPISEL
jgi:hypothetical protein